jgi:hypothetical protein
MHSIHSHSIYRSKRTVLFSLAGSARELLLVR